LNTKYEHNPSNRQHGARIDRYRDSFSKIPLSYSVGKWWWLETCKSFKILDQLLFHDD
jgi:hypothetical protein